jgi:hypothetical protein
LAYSSNNHYRQYRKLKYIMGFLRHYKSKIQKFKIH